MECMSCHTFERIVRSKFNADDFVPVLKRMANYANNTTQARVQMRVAPVKINAAVVAKLAAYLATHQSQQRAGLELCIENPAAADGRAPPMSIITEYDLPRQDDRAA